GIRVVDGERSTAYTGVEIAGAIAKERPPTKSRISGAGAIANERTITLKRAEVAAATIYTLSLRYRYKRKAGECEHCERGVNNIRSHFHVFISSHLLCERAFRSRLTLREEG